MQVFCNYLQETSHLRDLYLSDLPREQVQRLTEALHFNASVKTLHIRALRDDKGGLWIKDLLQHKQNVEALCFEQCSFYFSPLPSQGLTLLHTLVFRACRVRDDGVRMILEALMESGCSASLKELDLSLNRISSNGLYLLATQIPVALPGLEKLRLDSNPSLFENQKTTRMFANNLLLSASTSLKQLYIDRCGDVTPIIKACETNDRLQVLDIASDNVDDHQQCEITRSQLVESMPRMKGMRRLMFNFELFSRDTIKPMLTALEKNTGIVHIISNAETRLCIAPVMQRNRHLARIRCCSVHAESSSATFPWTRVLAKVGHGSQGATPVFTILCDRLATWIHPSQPAQLPPTLHVASVVQVAPITAP
jgi:hypothetical protein